MLLQLSEIEQIGTRADMVPADPLAAEVRAHLAEQRLTAAADDESRAQAHLAASDAFKPLFRASLITYKYQAADSHRATGKERFF